MTVVCSLTSWYHHLGFISYALQHNLQIKNLVLIRNAFFGKEALYEREVFDALAANVIFLENLEDLSASLGSDLPKDVLLFSSGLYPSQAARSLSKQNIAYKVITVEEGIGTYGTFYNKIRAVFREKKAVTNAVYGLSYTLLFCAALIVKKLQFRGIERELWLNFDIQSLVPNEVVNKGYSKALACCTALNKTSVGSDINSNDCFVISAPLCELGVMNEVDFIHSLTKTFAGYSRVFIKPHPIENTKKYIEAGFYILDSAIAVEKIAVSLDKKTDIYAFSSTSIYTLSIFLGLKVFRISSLDCLYEGLSYKQKKIIDTYSGNATIKNEH